MRDVKQGSAIKADWVVFLMGIIFLSAAVYRIFNYSIGIWEITQLGLPAGVLPFVIILEIIMGLMFILNKKVALAASLAIIFLGTAILSAVILNFSSIIANFWELFVFRANPTDIFLHIIYVAILLVILVKYLKQK